MKVSAKADIIHNIETAVRPKIGPEHPALIGKYDGCGGLLLCMCCMKYVLS